MFIKDVGKVMVLSGVLCFNRISDMGHFVA